MKAKVNKIEISYDLFGQNTPALLLLHGFGLNRTIWYEMVENYLDNQRVLLPDLRGHGESEVTTSPYDMPLMAQDVADLLETLSIDRAIVCGHSMGGYVALAFAEKFPDKLSGLGLITTNAAEDSPERRAGRYEQINQIRTSGSLFVADSLAPRLSNKPTVVYQSHEIISRCDPNGLIGALQGMATREDKTDLLSYISVPALVVAGENDQITDYEASRRMAASLPNGEFLGMLDTGHMPMLESPKELGFAIRALIKRVNTEKS
jgi:pimeloyl-ACP methyl ester carboxylesterase